MLRAVSCAAFRSTARSVARPAPAARVLVGLSRSRRRPASALRSALSSAAAAAPAAVSDDRIAALSSAIISAQRDNDRSPYEPDEVAASLILSALRLSTTALPPSHGPRVSADSVRISPIHMTRRVHLPCDVSPYLSADAMDGLSAAIAAACDRGDDEVSRAKFMEDKARDAARIRINFLANDRQAQRRPPSERDIEMKTTVPTLRRILSGEAEGDGIAVDPSVSSVLIAREYHHPDRDRGERIDECAAHFGSHDMDESGAGFWKLEKSDAPVPFVSGGVGPLFLAGASPSEKEAAIDSLGNLVRTVRASVDAEGRQDEMFLVGAVPVVSVSHGLVADGGIGVMAFGRYAVATERAAYRVDNPARGLAGGGDGAGGSYVLGRLNHPVAGKIIALTGMECRAFDQLALGLATHFMPSDRMPELERNLADIARETMGHSVGLVVNMHSDGNSETDDFLSHDIPDGEWPRVDETDMYMDEANIPPFTFGFTAESAVLCLAASLEDIFRRERTVAGIVTGLQAAAEDDEMGPHGREVAREVLSRILARSPLAQEATLRLISEGRGSGETMESCMAREKRVQLRLLQKGDFKAWAARAGEHGCAECEPPANGWTHRHVKDVTKEEVDELFAV